MSLHDNQITRHPNTPCFIIGPRQSSSRRDRRNGHPDCRCVPIQIVALQAGYNPPRSKPLPDWGHVHAELRRRGVTLALLWEEYRGHHPDGYGYSRYVAARFMLSLLE